MMASALSSQSSRLAHPQRSTEQTTESEDLSVVLEQNGASSSMATSSAYASPAGHHSSATRRTTFASPDNSGTPKPRSFSPAAGHTRVLTGNSSALVTVLPFSPPPASGLASWRHVRVDTEQTVALPPLERITAQPHPNYGSIPNNRIEPTDNRIARYTELLKLSMLISFWPTVIVGFALIENPELIGVFIPLSLFLIIGAMVLCATAS